MLLLPHHRRLALSGAIVAVLTLTSAVAASAPPRSSHASSTAVTHAAGASAETDSNDTNETDTDTETNNGPDSGNAVSTAAQSDLVGGAHQNHGGYVSCVARGGSNCTSSSPTLPSHGKPSNPGAPTR